MLATMTSNLGGRLPKQMQRALPFYVAVILLVLFVSNVDNFGSSLNGHDVASLRGRKVSRRDLTYEPSAHSSTGTQFPRKIWQSWKVDPLGFEERDSSTARTWTSKNPGHRYEVLTDSNDLYYVETHFGPNALNRPDIVYMYRSLTLQIIKADLLRYLVMYVEGGVYADIDVEALRPVDSFIPERYDPRDIDMIVGVEIDEPEFGNHPILGKKSQSFCQWTFICKPRLPVMLRLIDNIIKWLNDISREQGVPVSEVVLDFDQVISGTGPSAFTAALLAEMSVNEGSEVTWDSFHKMRESTLVGRILVLTVEAFAAGQGHSDSGNHESRAALVKHHYHASGWPSKHARYRHPVYEEVELCNWEPECVARWDDNTKVFDALSEDDKAKFMAFKEAADANRIAWEARKAAAEVFLRQSPKDQAKFEQASDEDLTRLESLSAEDTAKLEAIDRMPAEAKAQLDRIWQLQKQQAESKKLDALKDLTEGQVAFLQKLDGLQEGQGQVKQQAQQAQQAEQAEQAVQQAQQAPKVPELKQVREVDLNEIPPTKRTMEELTPEEAVHLAAFRPAPTPDAKAPAAAATPLTEIDAQV